MTIADAPETRHEIIIVRRAAHDGDHEHHGGVWKIAFADFMTAMMCFFLVMWLINASNEETKAAVASYFNPIKLTDRDASEKGLEQSGAGPSSPSDTSSESMGAAERAQALRISNPAMTNEAPKAADDQRHSDEHLFEDPFSVMAEIVAETGTLQNISAKGEGGAQDAGPATGASGGESFRDPFAPDFWSQQIAPTYETTPGRPATEEPVQERAAQPFQPPAGTAETRPATESKTAQHPTAPRVISDAALTTQPGDSATPPRPGDPAAADADAPAPQIARAEPAPAEAPAPAALTPPPPSEAAEREAEEIRAELRAAFGPGDRMRDGIDVAATADGILISVTDQLNFGMFEIGSATPKRELILAMEKIAAIVGSRAGNVRINGHTDARPFVSKSYDNWRLSSARAHSAYYMLLRGGLDERRVAAVGGFADRKLKVQDDPFADANRRIEILLETAR